MRYPNGFALRFPAAGVKGSQGGKNEQGQQDLIVGLDIWHLEDRRSGRRTYSGGRLNVIGMGSQESKGLKKGVVVNIEETVATIRASCRKLN